MPEANSETLSSALIEKIWRTESPKLIAALTRMVRDLSLAEELTQDAMMIALKTWPETGVPRNPAAWLMATAKRRAIDLFRRNRMAGRKLTMVQHDLETDENSFVEASDRMLDDDFGDDVLRLIFTACHPILSLEARTALALKLVCGLTTPEIARAFLVPEPTVAQRIVRAKKSLADAGVAFEVPRGQDRADRLAAVLAVVYLVFNEGYSATAGDDLLRPQLMQEAMRLGQLLVRLSPDEAEVQGLAGLMALQASRANARVDGMGHPVLLADQDRALWDRGLISRGRDALGKADALGKTPGPYHLQARIAACHASAATAAETDWSRIADLYEQLYELTPSPVVALNHAVAAGMADGPEHGLRLADELVRSGALDRYHLLPAVRAEFLMRLGRTQEAADEFRAAAALTQNARERDLLLARAAGMQ
jgi:RNA polymerase sigma factor (sigma-70 family)